MKLKPISVRELAFIIIEMKKAFLRKAIHYALINGHIYKYPIKTKKLI